MSTLAYFLMWGAIIFFMMRFGCGAHVMGHGHHRDGTKAKSLPLSGNTLWVAPSTAVDPVCGMTVEPAKAKSALSEGHVFYFCSENCREKFEASPKPYSSGTTNLPQNMEHRDEHQH